MHIHTQQYGCRKQCPTALCDMCASDLWDKSSFIHGELYGIEVFCCNMACFERLEDVWKPAGAHRDLFARTLLGTFVMGLIVMLFTF